MLIYSLCIYNSRAISLLMKNLILILDLVRLRPVKNIRIELVFEAGLHQLCLVSQGCDSHVSILMQQLHLNQWL